MLRLRNRLQRAEVGLSGARAIRQELRAHRLLRTLPALSTINRWLKAAGLEYEGGEHAQAGFLSRSDLRPRLGFLRV